MLAEIQHQLHLAAEHLRIHGPDTIPEACAAIPLETFGAIQIDRPESAVPLLYFLPTMPSDDVQVLWTGSSGHLHMSLWDRDDDRPLMHAAEGESEGPYGLGERGAQFVAGMMALSRELAVFIAPFVNSYKRYASLSWAPVNVVWGRDNT